MTNLLKSLSRQSIHTHKLLVQVEKDKLILKIESARNGKPWDEIDKTDETQVSI